MSSATNTDKPKPSLNDFRDSVPREKRMREPVGRSWSVAELRRKSFVDCHKLWYVLYKERNMLLTELKLSSRSQLIMPQPERLQKVKKSMGAIRHVLGERKQEKLAAVALRRAQMEEDEKGSVGADDSMLLSDEDDSDGDNHDDGKKAK
ncbi:Mitochondrial 39-S ribosomal protein L47 (MRP-L47) [Fragilaria crotonensis]|nr:Mitochondrial 39-S ribosomal protein L47 (MRP-L47) [Fragilaria crotonensis]